MEIMCPDNLSSSSPSDSDSPGSMIDLKHDDSHFSEYNGSPDSPLSSPEPPSVMQEPKSLLSTVSVSYFRLFHYILFTYLVFQYRDRSCCWLG